MRMFRNLALVAAGVFCVCGSALAATKDVATVSCNTVGGVTIAIDTTVASPPAVGGSCAAALQFFRNAKLKFVGSPGSSGSVTSYTLSN